MQINFSSDLFTFMTNNSLDNKENDMSQVWHFIKLAGTVLFGFAAAIAVFIAMPYAIPCGVVSLAFAHMPE
jgi:hypothetical protein